MINAGSYLPLATLFLLGWGLLALVRLELSAMERIALAYGVGAGVWTYGIFLVSLLGLPLSLGTGIAAFAVLGGIAATGMWRGGQARLAEWLPHRSSFTPTEQLLAGLVTAALGTVFLIAVYWPPYAWDALAIWVLKGKLIAATGSLAQLAISAHPAYPLNVPIQIAYLFIAGSPDAQLPIPVYLVGIALVIFANLRLYTSRTIALLCALFLVATPAIMWHATIAYADVPFAFYYVGSAIYLYRYIKQRESSLLFISALLVGLATWTRFEGLLYLAINVVVLVLFSPKNRRTLRDLALYCCVFIVFYLPWTLYVTRAGLSDETSYAFSGLREILAGHLDITRIASILSFFGSSATNMPVWGLIWFAFPAALLVSWRRWREYAVLITLIGLNFLGLIYTYYSAAAEPSASLGWWLSTGFDRMALHWSPLLVFFLGVTISKTGLDFREMFDKRISIDPYFVLLLLFSVFAIGPLLAPGYFWGAHDGRHSVYFLFEFDRSIQDGILYPRWAPDFTFGYGYPMFNIYAPGALYVSEALHLLGFDFVTATKIVFGLALVLTGPAMFGFIRRLTGSSAAAFLSGLAYVYIPYHLADIYVRAALEESVALIFLPLTLWGFYEMVVRPSRLALVATALAYAALAFTHNGIALNFTVVLAVWVLFLMIGEARKRGLRLSEGAFAGSFVRSGLPALAAVLLGIGLASIFLIPALLEYQFVRTDQWLGTYYSYAQHFVYLFQFFSPSWGFGISVPGPKDGMPFQLGIVPVLLALFSFVAVVRNPGQTRRFWLFFLAMTVVVAFLMLGVAMPIWGAVPILSYFQFPWRLEAFTTVSLAAVAGAIALLHRANGEEHGIALPVVLLGVLILAGSYPYLTAQMQLEAKEGPVSMVGLMKFERSAGEMTGSTAWVKEIPIWSDMADTYLANKRVKTKIVTTDYPQDVLWIGVIGKNGDIHPNGERVAFTANEDNLAITFNIFYYPGWRAYLVKPWTTEVIRELPIEPVGELGLMRVPVPRGADQWLLLRFDDTLPRIIGGWITALSILAALGLLIWDVRAKRKSRALSAA